MLWQSKVVFWANLMFESPLLPDIWWSLKNFPITNTLAYFTAAWLSKLFLCCHDTKHKDTQNNNNQHNNIKNLDTRHNNDLSLCWVSHFIFYYADCRYADCHDAIFAKIITWDLFSSMPSHHCWRSSNAEQSMLLSGTKIIKLFTVVIYKCL